MFQTNITSFSLFTHHKLSVTLNLPTGVSIVISLLSGKKAEVELTLGEPADFNFFTNYKFKNQQTKATFVFNT